MAQTTKVFGESVLRKEDDRFLTGRGNFVADMLPPGTVFAKFVRSPYAHARIRSINTAKARRLPGVLDVLTAEDLKDQVGDIITAWAIPNANLKTPAYPPLAREVVRYAGEAVAVVVAENTFTAEDGRDLVEVEYDPLPVVEDGEVATKKAGAPLHGDAPDNVAFKWTLAGGDIDKVFNEAEVVASQRFVNQRLQPTALEPRAAIAQFEPGTRELTLNVTSQNPFVHRLVLAIVLKHPEHLIHVIAPDVGGGFGSKIPDDPLRLHGRRMLRDPSGPCRGDRGLHEHDARRRLPWGGSAGGLVPPRANRRHPRAEAEEGSRGHPAEELHSRGQVPVCDRDGPHGRQRELSGDARESPRQGRLREASEGAGPGPPEGQADGNRPVDVRRDLRARSFRGRHVNRVRRWPLGCFHRPAPSDRKGNRLYGGPPARSGRRDNVRPDRPGRARDPNGRCRGCAWRHETDAVRPRHVWQSNDSRGGRVDCVIRPQGEGQGAKDCGASPRSPRGRSRVRGREVRREGLAEGRKDDPGNCVGGLHGGQPAKRRRARSRCDDLLRSHELRVPVRLPYLRRRCGPGDGPREDPTLCSRR